MIPSKKERAEALAERLRNAVTEVSRATRAEEREGKPLWATRDLGDALNEHEDALLSLLNLVP